MKFTKKLLSIVTCVVAAAMALSLTAFAASGDATVTASELNMRDEGSMDGNVIDAAPRGVSVFVISDDGTGWCQVSYNGHIGYMSSQYLSFDGGTEVTTVTTTTGSSDTGVNAVTDFAASSNGSNGTIQGTYVRFRSGPSLTSEVYGYLHTGAGVQVNGAVGDWYEVVCGGTTGYVYGTYVTLNNSDSVYTVTAPATVTDDAPIYSEPTDTTTAGSSDGSTETDTSSDDSSDYGIVFSYSAGQTIVDTAMQFLGVPYVWAGTSPDVGFDCSGLVYYVYGLCGYRLNRVAQSMYYNGTDVDISDWSNLMPGDILLFGSSVYNIWHAAIYIGNGQFIHSPYSGQVVSVESLYGYGLTLVAARRIV